MRSLDDLEAHLAAARQAFLRHLAELRPALHRYCTRMTGSTLDGEDLVQETLATAYYKLSLLKQDVPLRAWLFTIAHHKCIDLLRASRPHDPWSPESFDTGDVIEDPLERRAQIDAAFRQLLLVLPPAERACVVLKDVLDFTLEEIAETLETTVGGVKSALHRGREKLREAQARGADVATSLRLTHTDRLAAFVDRFDARDWRASPISCGPTVSVRWLARGRPADAM
jgi:RNA polymerase sigma-70 factor, ECF subfamily